MANTLGSFPVLLFEDMQKITLVFERIWYGKIELTKEEFLKVEQLFLKPIPAN